jgi:phosphoserine phosphatase RsbU/P
VLIADDETVSRRVLRGVLTRAGHEVVEVAAGVPALDILNAIDAPHMAILDWMMPGMDGPDVCRAIRASMADPAPYLILLTARDQRADVVSGLDAGADDYLTKPFDPDELRARVRVGERILALQQALADRVHALERTLSQVQQLEGLLPICAWCHKIRDDAQHWQPLEHYLAERSATRFTHTICHSCRTTVMQDATSG